MRRSSAKFALIALLAAGLFALAPAAQAAKGTGGSAGGKGGKPSGGSGTISVVMVSDQNADGLPNWGDSIRFNVSTTATTEPHVSLQCSQGGTVVYTAQTGYYASYPWPSTQTFSLSSGAWTSGAASCSARLYSLNNSGASTTLATTSFAVAA
ncbi:MAG: hypothetical protein QOI95_2758 [Acidimicrobiaceae bacterium]|jgi:hypothetical protein